LKSTSKKILALYRETTGEEFGENYELVETMEDAVGGGAQF
jgi:ribosomal protein S17E